MIAKFPVLCLGEKGYLNGSRTMEDLTRCTRSALKSQFFQKSTYVDASGTLYRVINAEDAYPPKNLIDWVKSLPLPLTHARLTFAERTEQVSLDDLKQRVLDQIDADPGYWSEQDDLQKLKTFISNCTSHRQLISYFCR